MWGEMLNVLWDSTGFNAVNWQDLVMFCAAFFLLYLAIRKNYEPLLLVPIAFGMMMANFPASGIMDEGGLLYILYQGIHTGLYPPLIFLGVGAMTDFGPLIANPRNLLLGAAAQVGIFATFLGAYALDFSLPQSASIAIIGGADGPTAIFLASRLSPEVLAPVAIAAYAYMALVPIIQPKIMYALTTKSERRIRMSQLRDVSKLEKILFPIVVTLFGALLIPTSLPLLGMLMFGNLLRECGVTGKLAKTAQNEIVNIVTVFLGLTVGATADAATFLTLQTITILLLGVAAFAAGTASGVLFGKLATALSGGRVNPLIGAAGVSAVPMAARVVQKVGQEADPGNHLLMHAMGPNVAGVIGSAIAAGLFLALLGG